MHPIPDLVRGLRTAARTLELADPLEAGRVRTDMLAGVQRDLDRLANLLADARAESQVA